MSLGADLMLQAAARRANQKLVTKAQSALLRIFDEVDLDDYDAVRKALEEAYPTLVKTYGNAAAEFAGQWYTLLRDAKKVEGGVRVVLDEVPELPVLHASVGNAVHSLYTSHDADACINRLKSSLTRHVMQMERNTIAETAAEDRRLNGTNAGWGISANPGCCDWCREKDTKGTAMYHTRANAEAVLFHDGCTCLVTPMIKWHDWKARARKRKL